MRARARHPPSRRAGPGSPSAGGLPPARQLARGFAMKVFVAGATGTVGTRAVTLLLAAGHQVTGLARSAQKASLLASQGARPVQASLFDPGALGRAVAGHDAVVNLATHIPVGAAAVK